MAKHRRFTAKFKAEVVLEALRGESSQAELCRRFGPHLNTSLTLKPLQEALLESGAPEIHHSDQGVQYLSTVYLSTLKEHGIEISLARRGCPWENGYVSER